MFFSANGRTLEKCDTKDCFSQLVSIAVNSPTHSGSSSGIPSATHCAAVGGHGYDTALVTKSQLVTVTHGEKILVLMAGGKPYK